MEANQRHRHRRRCLRWRRILRSRCRFGRPGPSRRQTTLPPRSRVERRRASSTSELGEVGSWRIWGDQYFSSDWRSWRPASWRWSSHWVSALQPHFATPSEGFQMALLTRPGPRRNRRAERVRRAPRRDWSCGGRKSEVAEEGEARRLGRGGVACRRQRRR